MNPDGRPGAPAPALDAFGTTPDTEQPPAHTAVVAALTDLARSGWTAADGNRHQVDFAAALAEVLACVAANVGGIEELLAGRPGSWEADLVHQLLAGTVGVGWGGEFLPAYRTTPILVPLDIEDVLWDVTGGRWAQAWEDLDEPLRVAAEAAYDAALAQHEGEAWVVPAERRAQYSFNNTDEDQVAAIVAELSEEYRQIRDHHPEVATAYAAFGAADVARASAEKTYAAALIASCQAEAERRGYRVKVVDVPGGLDPDDIQPISEALLALAVASVPAPAPPGPDWTPPADLIEQAVTEATEAATAAETATT